MSINPPSPLDNELAHAKQHDLEEKAARYSQLHPAMVLPKRLSGSWHVHCAGSAPHLPAAAS